MAGLSKDDDIDTKPQVDTEPPLVAVNRGGVIFGKCTHNHAATIGCHATDGCNQFLSSSNDPIHCEVCGCHRNYHKPEPTLRCRHCSRLFTSIQPLAVTPISVLLADHHGGDGSSSSCVSTEEQKDGSGLKMKTRAKRTTFTEGQKREMRRFAEEKGWRWKKNDREETERFCEEVGVIYVAFRVWVSNNRNKKDAR